VWFAAVPVATMLCVRLVGLSLLAAVAMAGADETASTSQLRGSAATPAEAATAKSQADMEDEMLQLTQCKCSTVECSCASSAPGSPPEEEQQHQQAVLNHTKALLAFWEANGGMAGQTACSCESGSSQCHCELVDGLQANAEEHPAPFANGTSLLSDQEQALSLWWARRGGWVRGGGWRRGVRCGRGRFGGCRCGGFGCGCGGVRGGGCGWR